MAANLKEVRDRIKSVINTQQITKAMKMVSAAKLRKAQRAIVDMRPYADKMDAMLRNVMANAGGDSTSSFGKVRPVKNVAIVVVTSTRGLCGAFNTNIIKKSTALLREQYATQLEAGGVTIIPIGRKGYDFFRKNYKKCKIVGDYVDLFLDLNITQINAVSSYVMAQYEAKGFDAIHVVYAQFKNAATQFPEQDLFLPVPPPAKDDKKKKSGTAGQRADYIFEPDPESLLDDLIPGILQVRFHKYLLDTHASEHGARMTAMDKATENADEILRNLKITYNKARQEAITKELSEIVGGAAALNG